MNAKTHGARSPKRLLSLGFALAFVGAAVGCNVEMRNDSRLKAYEGSEVFKDGRSARPIPQGTVARDHLKVDEAKYAGTNPNGQPVATIPPAVLNDFQAKGMDMKAMLERGRERYNIYCSVCHGVDGYGKGPVVLRGFPDAPNYHQDRLRRAPIGHFYDVATNGYGVMYGYWDRVDTDDRWAIAAYIKTLQYSQYAPAADLPADEQQKVSQNYTESPAGEGEAPTTLTEGHAEK